MTQVDTVLEHYGTKGMRWGVRKRRSSSSDVSSNGEKQTKEVFVKDSGKGIKTKGGHKLPASTDALLAAAAKQKAAKSGIKSLSNNELKALVNRMNLESQHKKLAQQEQTKSKGKKFVDDFIINTGRQVVGKEVANVVAKVLEKNLKKVVKTK